MGGMIFPRKEEIAGGSGGNGGWGSGGDGSNGRIAVYYENSFSAPFTPNYLYDTGAGTLDSIFADGYESNDLLAWTWSVTDLGDLAASSSADYYGHCGMAATIDDTNQLYVSDSAPADETSYRARIYMDPNGLTMAAGDSLDLLKGGASARSTSPCKCAAIPAATKCAPPSTTIPRPGPTPPGTLSATIGPP
ncbi:MAG: hypothetical protein IH859_01435 [Chloroflexi bacterium]|nr:hypothetical protein [Chloroflexota bacterium]